MGCEEFWYGSPYHISSYISAYEKKQREIDAANFTMGRYVLLAIAQVASNFSGKHKSVYPQKPFSMEQKEKEVLSLDDRISLMLTGKTAKENKKKREEKRGEQRTEGL